MAVPVLLAPVLQRIVGLFRNLAIYGLGDSATSIVSFLLLPVYVRYLGPEDYGVISLLLTVEVVSKILFRWGVDASFMRLYYDCPDRPSRQRLASTIFWFLAVVNGSLLALGLLASPALSRHLFNTDRYATVLALTLVNTFVVGLLLHPLPRPADQGPVAAVHRPDVLSFGRDARGAPGARRGVEDGRAGRRAGRRRGHGDLHDRCWDAGSRS